MRVSILGYIVAFHREFSTVDALVKVGDFHAYFNSINGRPQWVLLYSTSSYASIHSASAEQPILCYQYVF